MLPVKVYLNNCRASLDLVAFQGAPVDQLLDARTLELIERERGAVPSASADAALVGRGVRRRGKGLEVGDQFRFGEHQREGRGHLHVERAGRGGRRPHAPRVPAARRRPSNSSAPSRSSRSRSRDPARAREIARAIDELLPDRGGADRHAAEDPVPRGRDARPARDPALRPDASGSPAWSWCCSLVGNTVLMSVQERVREFGVLRTLGFREGHVAARRARRVARRSRGAALALGLAVAFVDHQALAPRRSASEGVPVSFDALARARREGRRRSRSRPARSPGSSPPCARARAPIVAALEERVMGRAPPLRLRDPQPRRAGRCARCSPALSSALVAALLVATAAFVRGLETIVRRRRRRPTSRSCSRASPSATSCARPSRPAARARRGRRAGHPARPSGVPAVSGRDPHGRRTSGSARAPAAGAPDPELQRLRPRRHRARVPRARVGHAHRRRAAGHAARCIVGRLVARAARRRPRRSSRVGKTLRFEGGEFTIAGRFAAPGTTIEAEIWAPLAELRGLTRRDDSSAVFVRMQNAGDFAELDLFAKRRLDLELDDDPVVALLPRARRLLPRRSARSRGRSPLIMAFAALFGGANTLNAAVQDRLRELATLRALGYSGFALVRSLATEALVLAAAGGLVGLVARADPRSPAAPIRIAMSAFALQGRRGRHPRRVRRRARSCNSGIGPRGRQSLPAPDRLGAQGTLNEEVIE